MHAGVDRVVRAGEMVGLRQHGPPVPCLALPRAGWKNGRPGVDFGTVAWQTPQALLGTVPRHDQSGDGEEPNMADKPILATMTGEFFQPVRLHYQVFDHDGLLRAFKKLRCVQHDPTQQRWVWLYDHEAKALRFQRSYAEFPKDLHPIVIGSFFLRTKDKLLLDLRSCERAILAIPFFAKHLPLRVAKVTESEIVNKLFSATENPQLKPDDLFDRPGSSVRDPAAVMQKIIDRASQVRDPRKRFAIAQEELDSQARQLTPDIERFPVHYHEDGIGGFEAALRMRQIVAREHWLGNTRYTLLDAIKTITKEI
jgi:hypothetical protein